MEDKRKIPEIHPALDKLYEYVRNNPISASTKLYIHYLLEAVCEGSIWTVRIGKNEYEIHADILESDK